jgi:hypothetical protein
MTPEQKINYDRVIGMAQRVAMKIAELPKEHREAAILIAKKTLLETFAEYGITDPKFAEVCSEGIAAVLREIEASGSPGGGNA